MALDSNEIKAVEKYRQEQAEKINSSDLPDEVKKDRLAYLETEQYHRLKPLTVKEVAPHQWEAF